jgi:serine/threonine protein phosphatase PrpC
VAPLAPGTPDGLPHGAPSRHRLLRFLGTEGDATPDVRTVELQAGDRLLLCTDGVTGALPDRLIAHLLRHQGSPEEACRVLLGAVGQAGGKDNATVVVAFVDAIPEMAPLAVAREGGGGLQGEGDRGG